MIKVPSCAYIVYLMKIAAFNTKNVFLRPYNVSFFRILTTSVEIPGAYWKCLPGLAAVFSKGLLEGIAYPYYP